MLSELSNRRVLILIGKGGAGRTTIAAALGMLAARRHARALLVEIDTRGAMAKLFGRAPSYAPIEVEPGLFLTSLDGPQAMEQYLSITVPSPRLLRSVFSSRLYKYFVQAAPGLRELIMIGKLYHEVERRPANLPAWDQIVFDAPASGQALSLLRMPLAADETFENSVVGREARRVAAFLRDPNRCAVVQVATAEPLVVAETIETSAALKKMGFRPAAIVFNRKLTVPFGARDIARFIRHGAGRKSAGLIEAYGRIARNHLEIAQRTAEARAFLRLKTHTPIIDFPEFPRSYGLDLVRRLVDWAERQGKDAEQSPPAISESL
ncbi:MAG: ArsA family ATPase [Candidatus Binataceae bacterium]